jgi:zinc/manganese transport system permease protein
MSNAPQFTWNLFTDFSHAWSYPFMVNAFQAGFIVAVLSGLVGWFMVLRRQSFVGHTLAVIGFPGATGAILLGISVAYGLFGAIFLAAILIGLVAGVEQQNYSTESAVTGTVQAFALACGFLFVSLYGGFLNGANALLFGSFLGISTGQVKLLIIVALSTLIVLVLIARPLFFASIDPDVAAARGVPVRGLSITFLLLLGAAAAEVSQITGSLLVFALLVVPPATSQILTTKPFWSVLLSVVIGLGVTWLSLLLAYYFENLPVGFFVTSIAFAIYLLSLLRRRIKMMVT